MTSLSDADRWQQWRNWFEDAYADITALFHHRNVWANLVKMLQSNTEVRHHSVVNEWLARGYSQTIALGVRRQWDHSQRRPTLGRLLLELAEHPHVASWERFHELAGDDSSAMRAGWLVFANTAGSQIDADVISADRDVMEEATYAARAWVNRRVAHSGKDKTVGPIKVTFADIHRGLEVEGALLQRYWMLFHPGGTLWRVTPDAGLGWLEMFGSGWLPDNFQPILPDDMG